MAGGTRSYEMARRLVKLGHEVHMITSWREDDGRRGWFETKEAGITVHWLSVPYSNLMGFSRRIKAFIAFAWGAARKVASIGGDVIFATSTPLTIALPAVIASRKLKIPMVFEVRDLWPEVPIALGVLRNPFLKWAAKRLERFAYDNSTYIVALAPGMATSIEKLGYDARRIAIVPNGSDSEFLSSNNCVDDGLDSISIGYIGTVGPANGVDYIPRLAKIICQRHPDINVRFYILGEGKTLNHVSLLANNLGVLNKNVFLKGSVPKCEVPMWLDKFSATIMTYDGPEVLYRDSVSNKFFDSIAAGRPVFSNFLGFSTNIAQHADAGVILSKDNLESAADMMIEKLTDREFMLNASRACRSLAENYFNRDYLATLLEKVVIRAVDDSSLSEQEELIGSEYHEIVKLSANGQHK